jgi:hypothetical protein
VYSNVLLERHKFEYALVQKALSSADQKEDARNLKFMNDIGLLSGLNQEGIKTHLKPDEQQQLPIFLGAAIRDHMITVPQAKGALKFLTYYDGPVNADPELAFRIAVMKFQRAKNLEIDGYLGPKTTLALWEACPECPGLLQTLQDTSKGSGE